MWKKYFTAILSLFLCFCFPSGVFADTGPPDHEISVTYFSEGVPISDTLFSLYSAGLVSDSGEIVWEDWTKGITDYEELSADGALFLQEQILLMQVSHLDTVHTDNTGEAVFSFVPEGVYLITGESRETDAGLYTIAPMWAVVSSEYEVVLLEAKHTFIPNNGEVPEPPASEIPTHTPTVTPNQPEERLPQTGSVRSWFYIVLCVGFGLLGINGFLSLWFPKKRNLFFCFGTVVIVFLIFCSVGIRLYDLQVDAKVQSASLQVMDQWPKLPVAELEQEDSEAVRTYGGSDYVGVLTIPRFGLVLPVQSEWSNANAKVSPCRYYGSADTSDMIIAAHNYKSHFGRLKDLDEGDVVFFMDALGNSRSYSVLNIEILEGTDVDKMKAGEDWDLTLFTCTYGGKHRVTVRLSEK